MSVSYDIFTNSFLSKITDYSFLSMDECNSLSIIDNFMKKSISQFNKVCKYDLLKFADDNNRIFNIEINEEDIEELSDIISEGMIVQWLKPYVYKQELLENILNTKDFTTYSPAELLKRVGETYRSVAKDYSDMILKYSYRHGDLGELHT